MAVVSQLRRPWSLKSSRPSELARLKCYSQVAFPSHSRIQRMNNYGGTREWLFYTFVGVLADALDTILTFVVPEKATERIRTSDVDALSDEAILELTETAPILHPDYNVYRLTPTTVVKSSHDIDDDAVDCPEANAMRLVFEKTTIPVPRVHRVVKGNPNFLIVMDYIKGQTLARVWPTFSVWRKFLVAFTLRRYIRQLHRLKGSPATPPGPLSVQGPQICESPVFGQVQSRRGPFSSYSELSIFFNARCKMALDAAGVPEDHPSRKKKFDDSGPLVLTHQDLNLRNVILGDDGRLWIVDWEWAGYYPPWFEFVATEIQAEDQRVSGTDDKLWKTLIPFICGPYFTQSKWLAVMSPAFCFA